MLSGRDAELGALRGLLAAARAGQGGSLVLSGQPGIGKSALLEAACPNSDGLRVLRATGYPAESQLPYAGLHLLLHPVLDRLDVLPAPQRDALATAFGLSAKESAEPADQLLISLALLTLLSELADTATPMLCLVDDAHWFDQLSLSALIFAARRLGTENVAIVMSARQGCALLERSGLPGLEVKGLPDAAAQEVIALRADRPSPAARAWILAQAHGNPLALLELPAVSALDSHGDAQPVPELPERLVEAFRAQIESLPRETLSLLKLAALADGPEVDALLRAAPLFGVPAEAIGPAERSGVLQVNQGTFGFRHPLLRSALVAATPVPRRLAAHRAYAGALTGPEEADRRIWHEAAAATGPDERLAAELERTAERAGRRGGRPAAIGAYERAAVLSPSPGDRLRRWILAAEAATDHGDAERAERCAGNAELVRAELAAAGQSLDAQTWMRLVIACATARFELGELREAYRIAYAGAQELGRNGGPLEAGTLLCLTVDLAWFLGDREVSAYSDLFTSLSGVSPEHPVYLVCLYVETAIMLSLRSDLGFRPADLAVVIDRVRSSGLYAAGPVITLGSLAPIMAQDEAALELFATLLAECREHGRMAWYSASLGALARVQAHLGRLGEARTCAEEALAIAEAAGQTQWESQVSGLLAYLAASAGDEERCREYARRALTDLAPTVMSLGESWGRWALGLLDLGLGRPAAALEHLRALENGPAVHQLAAARALPDLLEAAVRAGDRELAELALGRLTSWAAGVKQNAADALVLRGEALLAEDDESAGRAFTAALRLYVKSDRPFDRARTQLLWGERLRRERRRTEARAPLSAALETFERLGASPWAERARQELAASGAGGEPPRTRADAVVTRTNSPAQAALAVLTSQEAQIVRLAAQGLSNRDIAAQLVLSPRTVGHHLYKAYPKLGVVSRGELPALLGTR
ncbi:AAA family ATPase [Actinospica sp. MGRD01-02]|uniref:AAA family ATPase n=1 Tax=Actinospica acidithermotolerans TaxID=2828514 RepID=A0A941EG50_9ACTN|nr:helix-turn-helix transcriptional regulator [Actinospica acidithermotolerans]MBR7830822.1 AAA family ATPase [Actinospica acidithermotolerans]